MEKDSIHIANCNSGDNNDEDDDDKDGGNASDSNNNNNNKCDWIIDDSEAAGSKKICNLMSYQQDNVDPSIKRRNYHNEDMSFHDSAHAGLGVKKDEDNNNNNKCDWIEGEEEIEEPGDNDIILGRGGWSSNHQGNVNFRKLVNRYKIQYLACGKNDKPWVSKLVVKMWRNQSPPGRFLRRVDKALTTTTTSTTSTTSTTTGSNNIDIDIDTATPKYRPYVWREVTEKRSQAKASQCLRERTDGVLPYLQRMEVGNVMMGASTSASSAAASNHQRHNNNNSNNNNNNNNNIMPSTMMGMYAHQRPNMATTSLGGNIMNINSPVPTSLNYLQAQAQMHMAMKRRAIQNAYILNTTKAQSGNNNIHTYPHAHTNMSTRQQQQEMMRKQAMLMKMMMMKKRQAARMMMYKQYQQPRSNNNNNNMMAAAGCGATGTMQASNSLGIDQYGENMMNQQQHMMKQQQQQQQQQQLTMDAQENDRFVRNHAVTNPNSDIHTPHHNTFKQTMKDKSEMNDENYTNSPKNFDDDNDGIGDGIDDDDKGHADNNEGRVDNGDDDNDDDNDVGHCDEGQPIPLSVMPDDSQQSTATGNEAFESIHDCTRKMSVTNNREGSDIASSAALAAAASELSLSDTIVDGDHKMC